MNPRLLQGTVIGGLAGALVLAVWTSGGLDRWEARTWDWRVAAAARPGRATADIRLVLLDQGSLDWGVRRGWSWPWPREVYAPVVDFCRRAGARAVAFDVLFSEPSAAGVEDDLALGASAAASRSFVAAVFPGREAGAANRWPSGLSAPTCAWQTTGSASNRLASAYRLPLATFPVSEIATNAAGFGAVADNPDPDGIYRRATPLRLFDGRMLPALGLALHLAARPDTALALRERELVVGPHRIPLDRRGRAILRFRGPSQTHAAVNIAAVIESEMRLRRGRPPLIAPARFAGAYVLLGYTAPGLFDLKPTPVAPVYPGVEIHATFLDNLLSDDFVREAPAGAVAAVTLLLALAAGLGVRLAPRAWHGLAILAGCLLAAVLAGVVAYARGFWLPVIPPFFAAAPAGVAALGASYATEGRQKRFIKAAFRQYLSPVVIEQLLRQPDRLRLGGEQRELTMLFSDVRGFTGVAERLSPPDLTRLLNAYLTAMTAVIHEQGGTIDKYEGDAVIAFWNAPLDQPDHPIRAARAALRCQERLAALQPELHALAGVEVVARIGVNTGPVVVGNMGSDQRFNYTFLGDAGNLAARLEGLNKVFDTRVLLSEATRRACGDAVRAREIARVRVVGRDEPVRVFEPVRELDAARLALWEAFARALEAYAAGRFDEALRGFEALGEQDGPARAYARRCRDLLDNRPAVWDGVWVMTEK